MPLLIAPRVCKLLDTYGPLGFIISITSSIEFAFSLYVSPPRTTYLDTFPLPFSPSLIKPYLDTQSNRISQSRQNKPPALPYRVASPFISLSLSLYTHIPDQNNNRNHGRPSGEDDQEPQRKVQHGKPASTYTHNPFPILYPLALLFSFLLANGPLSLSLTPHLHSRTRSSRTRPTPPSPSRAWATSSARPSTSPASSSR